MENNYDFVEKAINAVLKVTNVDRKQMLSYCKIRECVDARRMLITILYQHGFTQRQIADIVCLGSRYNVHFLLRTHSLKNCKKYEIDFNEVKKIMEL